MKLPQAQYLLPVSVGLLAGSLLVGLYLLLLCLPVVQGLGAQWFVPVLSLLVGHSTTTSIRGLSAYHSALQTDAQEYEFLRGNGATHFQALRPFFCRALQSVFAPTVANLSVMGLFTMPLLLVGILLGGLTPLVSFVLTLLLVVGCLASSVLSLGVTLWLANRPLFAK
jgi:putative ABC transport system permease protein